MKIFFVFPVLVLAVLVNPTKCKFLLEEPEIHHGSTNVKKVTTVEEVSNTHGAAFEKGPILFEKVIADPEIFGPASGNQDGLAPEGSPVQNPEGLVPEGPTVEPTDQPTTFNPADFVTAVEGVTTGVEGSTTHDAYVINCLYERPDCFCLDYIEPVCAINGCTYSNDCRRVCAEVELAYKGPCRSHLADLDGDD